jgi:hypothetical protein
MTVAAIIAIIQADKVLKRLREKILSNRGTFRDTFEYSNRAAELLGANFSESVLAMSLDDRVSACVELLRDRYDDIMPLLDAVQKRADLKNKLAIAPKHPPFNAERAEQIGTSLRDLSVSDERIQRRARSAPATATRAIHDDYIEANVELRSSAGIKCYISRVTDGNCCDWCTRVAGRYEYGTEPEGIFHRHDNCGCSVTYENGRERQDVWSKKTWTVPEDAGAPEPVRLTKEQAAAAGAPTPKVFSKEEAKKLETEKLKGNKIVLEPDKVHNSSIDNSDENGIMNMRRDASEEEIEWLPKGDKISVAEFKELRDYAKTKGVSLQGFKTSDVDTKLIRESIDSIAQVTDVFPELKGNERKPLTLSLSDTMRANDFASTEKGVSHIIKINGNAFRDSAKLEKEYQKLVDDMWFVQGTTKNSIVKHELGHLYQTVHSLSDETIIDMAMKASGINDKKTLFRFLGENLSLYSGRYKDGSEIISEVFSDYFGSKSPTNFSKMFMRELIEMR